MSRASPANGADLSHEKIFTFQQHTALIRSQLQAFALLKAAMPFNFSSPALISHHKTRKNRVSRARPAHINSSKNSEYLANEKRY